MSRSDINRTGDITELRACTWLLELGCEVFRNVGSTGPIDIVAIKDGKVQLLDVKSNRTSRLTPIQAAMGVALLIECPDKGFRIEGASDIMWRKVGMAWKKRLIKEKIMREMLS